VSESLIWVQLLGCTSVSRTGDGVKLMCPEHARFLWGLTSLLGEVQYLHSRHSHIDILRIWEAIVGVRGRDGRLSSVVSLELVAMEVNEVIAVRALLLV